MFDPVYVQENFPAVRPAWLARHVEAPVDPAQPIVDAHHHLWLIEGSVYLGDDLLLDARSGHRIRSTVAVECKARYRTEGPEAMRPVGETEFVRAETVAMHADGFKPCAAIVGWADLQLGDAVEPVLEQHLETGQGRFRGLRARAAWHDDPAVHSHGDGQPGLLLDSRVQRGIRRAASLGLSIDVWAFHTQLQEVARLASACPDVILVLDHCGAPLGIGPCAGRRQEVFDVWRSSISELARHDNVVVKLSGLGMPRIGFGFADADTPPTSIALAKAWAPYFEQCIEAFGAERCMFASNFPIDKGIASYSVIWNAFQRIASGCSSSEKTALFSGTASATYRIAL